MTLLVLILLLMVNWAFAGDPNSVSRKNYYDKNNRLIGQSLSEGFSIGYEYDGNGNLTRKGLLDEDSNSDTVPDIL